MEPFLGEIIGTAILILLGDGVVANVVLAKTKGNSGGWIVITAGWGFAVFAGVYAVAAISGAHINPAVTLGLAISGSWGEEFFTGWGDVPVYMLGQMIGAMIGATLVYLSYMQHFEAHEDPAGKRAVFSTAPEIRSTPHNLMTEIIGTFMLVFGVLMIAGFSGSLLMPGEGTEAIQGSLAIDAGALGALPVAILVFAIGLSLGGPTGYAINPARDLGPRIMHQLLPIPGKGDSDWGYSWIPVVGPFIGAAIAAVLWMVLPGFGG